MSLFNEDVVSLFNEMDRLPSDIDIAGSTRVRPTASAGCPTTPNAVTAAVHDRMPVILDPDSYDLWLDPGMRGVRAASELLKPYDARLMRCYPVSSRINHVTNDDGACSTPVELAQIQNRLFL